MKLSAVIVNYNDANSTIELAQKLISYDSVDFVIVVDNASTDTSTEILNCIKNEKYHLYINKINSGYGQGNNIGIMESKEKFDCSHCLIVNPDVDISESAISELKNAFIMYSSAIIVAPSTFASGRRAAWHINGFCDLVLSKGKIFRKLTKAPFYSKHYFDDKNYCQVDAVLGACLMIDIEKFIEVGMYDKNMFLYEEENYLAIRCKQCKYKTIVLCNYEYIHNHKDDNHRSLAAQLRTHKQMSDSLLYLVKNYYKYGFVLCNITKLFLLVCRFEIVLCKILRRT